MTTLSMRTGRRAAVLALLAAVAIPPGLVTPAHAVTTRTPLWSAASGGEGYGLAAAPHGRLFVGFGEGLTICYDQQSGAQRWATTIADVGLRSLAADHSGSAVFVLSQLWLNRPSEDVQLTALNAGTGATLWSVVHNQRSSGVDLDDSPRLLAVSPDDSTVFVAGYSTGPSVGSGLVLAFSARTGRLLWSRSAYHFYDMTVSPDSSTVYGVGQSSYRFQTVALDAATGATVWEKRYAPGGGEGLANHVAVSPDGTRVFVAGGYVPAGLQYGLAKNYDVALVAYGAAHGARRWTARYASPGLVEDLAYGLVPAAGNEAVALLTRTGYPSPLTTTLLAYDAASGAARWSQHPTVPYERMAVAPDGSRLYVVASSEVGLSTAAYRSGTGSPLWTARIPGSWPEPISQGSRTSIAVSPGGYRVFVSGVVLGDSWETAAYAS